MPDYAHSHICEICREAYSCEVEHCASRRGKPYKDAFLDPPRICPECLEEARNKNPLPEGEPYGEARL